MFKLLSRVFSRPGFKRFASKVPSSKAASSGDKAKPADDAAEAVLHSTIPPTYDYKTYALEAAARSVTLNRLYKSADRPVFIKGDSGHELALGIAKRSGDASHVHVISSSNEGSKAAAAERKNAVEKLKGKFYENGVPSEMFAATGMKSDAVPVFIWREPIFEGVFGKRDHPDTIREYQNRIKEFINAKKAEVGVRCFEVHFVMLEGGLYETWDISSVAESAGMVEFDEMKITGEEFFDFGVSPTNEKKKKKQGKTAGKKKLGKEHKNFVVLRFFYKPPTPSDA